ncbi:MAG: transposase [Erythrobacter sp.]|nr:MAG: transposase [Erythrobacter sp.]
MPRVVDCLDQAACELGDCIEALHASGFHPWEEESLLGAAHWLRRLGNNRDFLGDMLLDELKRGVKAAEDASDYGPQVIMLSTLGSEFYMRANFWPSVDEHMFRASGRGAFSYELPHDHDFDFLTLGYFGPGYASDYWEYDYERVAGAIGEAAGLQFVERSTLTPGKLMHYRAHLDVHSQLPPESLSVSLNVMHAGGAQGWLDQYRFDVEKNEIAGVISPGGSETFLRVAVGLGGEEARDLAHHFAGSHPSDRMRLTALEAQAGVLGLAERDALWRRAEASSSRLVALEAARKRRILEFSS